MSTKIDFTEEVKIGETVIDEIIVHHLSFLGLSKIWQAAGRVASKQDVFMQRERIFEQTHFMSAGKRVTVKQETLSLIPFSVAKKIRNHLEDGNGVQGKVIKEGDGCVTPILYELGTPVSAKSTKGDVIIKELEFIAKTYGEAEEVLAAENELAQAVALLRVLASPVGTELMVLPGWALERITVADGLSIMRNVLPHF